MEDRLYIDEKRTSNKLTTITIPKSSNLFTTALPTFIEFLDNKLKPIMFRHGMSWAFARLKDRCFQLTKIGTKVSNENSNNKKNEVKIDEEYATESIFIVKNLQEDMWWLLKLHDVNNRDFNPEVSSPRETPNLSVVSSPREKSNSPKETFNSKESPNNIRKEINPETIKENPKEITKENSKENLYISEIMDSPSFDFDNISPENEISFNKLESILENNLIFFEKNSPINLESQTKTSTPPKSNNLYGLLSEFNGEVKFLFFLLFFFTFFSIFLFLEW